MAQLTWNEIKEKYPHKYVELSNIIYGANSATIAKAEVCCTSQDTKYEDMIRMYIEKKIVLRYTTMDEDDGRLKI